jgi:hypothetical protein
MLVNRRTGITMVFCLIFLLSFTFFRKILILVYPILSVLVFWVMDLRLSFKSILALLTVFALSIFSWVLNGLWTLNWILSLYLVIPSLFLILSRPSYKQQQGANSLRLFWNISSFFLIVVNISAFGTFLWVRFVNVFIRSLASDVLDDSFHGLYGSGGLGGHNLSIINIIYAVRFFTVKEYKKATFFLVSSILGFYGLGLILSIIALVWVFRKFILNIRLAKYLLLIGFLVYGAAMVIKIVNPQNYNYIQKSINSFLIKDFDYSREMQNARNYETSSTPRKITFFAGVYHRLTEDPQILLYGTTPGTYNSRAAFLLNGDLSKTAFLKENVQIRPPYHEKDIYYLFNSISTRIPWMGGTRHQPFSSIVSVLMEYGLLVFIIIFVAFLKMGRNAISNCTDDHEKVALKFTLTLSFLLFFFVYYLEVIEFMLPILIMFKVYEMNKPQIVKIDKLMAT